MGINLKDVNCIIHYGAPRSLEDYFQESGKAERSGADAKSTIYWTKSDCLVRKEPSTTQEKEAVTVQWYLENQEVCRRQWLLDYFDTQFEKPAQNPCMAVL